VKVHYIPTKRDHCSK